MVGNVQGSAIDGLVGLVGLVDLVVVFREAQRGCPVQG